MKKTKKNKTNKTVEPGLIKNENEESRLIGKLIMILIGVAAVSLLLYFVTAKFLVKDDFQKEEEPRKEETIAYTEVNVGNVFNRPYDKYYVFAYDPSSLKASLYASWMANVDKDTKIYFLNLSKEINKSVIGKQSNKNATNSSELSLKEPTLIQISKGKISAYIEDESEIEAKLK